MKNTIQLIPTQVAHSTGYQALDGYAGKVIEIIRKESKSEKLVQVKGKHRSVVLQEEGQEMKDILDFILNPPIYSPSEKLLFQKRDMEHTRELLSHTLPNIIQEGAGADIDNGSGIQSQKQPKSFIQQFGHALMVSLDSQFPDSDIPESIIQIYRGLMMNYSDKSQTNDWKRSLQDITIGETTRPTTIDFSSFQDATSNEVESMFEFHFQPDRILTKALAERVSSIFEIFEENYNEVIANQKSTKLEELEEFSV